MNRDLFDAAGDREKNAREHITRSMGEAHVLLKATRARLIAEGRTIAIEMLMLPTWSSGVTTGVVFREMERRGVPGLNSVKAYWLPIVFKCPTFEKASDKRIKGVGHDNLSWLWRLK